MNKKILSLLLLCCSSLMAVTPAPKKSDKDEKVAIKEKKPRKKRRNFDKQLAEIGHEMVQRTGHISSADSRWDDYRANGCDPDWTLAGVYDVKGAVKAKGAASVVKKIREKQIETIEVKQPQSGGAMTVAAAVVDPDPAGRVARAQAFKRKQKAAQAAAQHESDEVEIGNQSSGDAPPALPPATMQIAPKVAVSSSGSANSDKIAELGLEGPVGADAKYDEDPYYLESLGVIPSLDERIDQNIDALKKWFIKAGSCLKNASNKKTLLLAATAIVAVAGWYGFLDVTVLTSIFESKSSAGVLASAGTVVETISKFNETQSLQPFCDRVANDPCAGWDWGANIGFYYNSGRCIALGLWNATTIRLRNTPFHLAEGCAGYLGLIKK